MTKSNLKYLKLLLFVFLFIQVVPLLTRENMQAIVIFDYSVVLSLLFAISITTRDSANSIKFIYYIAITVVSFFLYLFGYAGSIAGFILAATVPYFMFNHFTSYKSLINTVFVPVKVASIILLVFGAILFWDIGAQINNMALMTKYFIKASINYVSLLFYGFTILYLLLYEVKKANFGFVSKFELSLGILLIFCTAFYSAMYLTRSTFLVALLLGIILLREYRKTMILVAILVFIIFRQEIYDYIIKLLGTDSVGELATQDIRVDSVNNLIENSLNFNYGEFSDTMSFSSLANLLFCLFPFTLVFLIEIVRFILSLILNPNKKKSLFYGLFLGAAIFICSYQMDFLSIFVLFTVGHLILLDRKLLDKTSIA